MKNKYAYPLGFSIIALGVVLLFQNLGFTVGPLTIKWNNLIHVFWPLILVLIGFARIKKSDGFMSTYFLIVLGVFFLLRNIANLHHAFHVFHSYSWPLLIIVSGLVLMLKPTTTEDEKQVFQSGFSNNSNKVERPYTIDPYYDDSATFYDDFEEDVQTNHDKATDQPVSERNYQTSLSSNTIVLRKSDLQTGLNMIQLHCSMGELNLSLPKSASITINGESTFGEISFDQKKHSGLRRSTTAVHNPPHYTETRIIVNAICKFGEINITLHDE